jgi:hypothetical protein
VEVPQVEGVPGDLITTVAAEIGLVVTLVRNSDPNVAVIVLPVPSFTA